MKTVQTADFVRGLERVNWHWISKQANDWIEMSVSTFKVISSDEGGSCTFTVYNPNGGRWILN